MFDIICTITVVTCMQLPDSGKCVNVVNTAGVQGKVKAEGEQNYVVDFSAEAKRKGYVGEYDIVVVSKDKCVRVAK